MKIGVYGLGRFGYFWSGLLASKFDVSGFNRSPMDSVPEGVRLVTEDQILDSDVLFLCISISSMETVLKAVAGRIKPGCLVFDTCSVKVHPIKLMKDILPHTVDIIASHPMFGPDSGKNGVEDLPLVFIPVRDRQNSAPLWKGIFRNFGLKIVEISAETHDEDAAYTQGVTHFIGRVLNELQLKENIISTSGYKSLLTIIEQTCNDPVQLFMDLQHYNPYTHSMRQRLNQSLVKIMEMLAEADPVNGL